MESTTSGPRLEQQEFAFEPGQDASTRAEKVQPGVNPEPVPAKLMESCPEMTEVVVPVWLQRLSIVIQVLFCIELGLLLAVLPWYAPIWNHNSLIIDHPTLRAILQQNFVRGLVTGLGLVDIWLGISEAVHYRDRKPQPEKR
jgi:hypothetical protein